jgi:hypothetical protein
VLTLIASDDSDRAGRLGSGRLTQIDPSDSDRDAGRIGPDDSDKADRTDLD